MQARNNEVAALREKKKVIPKFSIQQKVRELVTSTPVLQEGTLKEAL